MSRFLYRRRFSRMQGVQPPALPRNAVLHGDCVKVLATLPASSVDFVLTDPPYLVNYRDRAGRRVANDNDPAWLVPAFRELYRVLREDSLCVSFYGWQAIGQFDAAWRAAGFRPVGHLVFAKDYASSARFTAMRHESAYVLAKGRPALPQTALPDVLPFPYTGNRLHPTQKPAAPLRTVIEAFTTSGQLVLDPFAGSGSTLAAARASGRDWLGIELDAGHAATARARLAIP
jgi:site-specific DNA-methyltransferase (adenine-specific)